jgi:sigma-B regulation protein RsbU (phosphoserine phosphatase)
MATAEMGFLHGQLKERKQRLEAVIQAAPNEANLQSLLSEVDSALDRVAAGTYGLCDSCHEAIERDRLLADPLIRYCLDHLTTHERVALQRDLDLASELQRGLLPPKDLRAGAWETNYHYAPLGAVSGDYCDLYPAKEQLYFMLGDVSGKGVAASMRMTQLHALFRSLIGMGLPLAAIVETVNGFLCESGLSGQYATLVCGCAQPGGEVELFNAGHLPVIAVQKGKTQLLESTGFPVGMFRDASFSPVRVKLCGDDMLFLFTDGVSEADGGDGEYGVERIVNLLAGKIPCCAGEAVSACLEDLRAFVGTHPGMDDVTLLAIRHGL